MSLDLWGKDDIGNILLSAWVTMQQGGGDGEYRRGFEAALGALAVAFGLAKLPWGENTLALLRRSDGE